MIEPNYTAESMLDVLLDRHQIITIVVMPGLCAGLGGFPADVPLKLNLGHTLQPPMAIRTESTGLDFFASFNGAPRTIHVPWPALLFAGTEAALRQLLTDAERPTVTKREDNVVAVDFAAKRGRK